MSIDWAALGQVFGVTLVVTVGIVGLFTLGIVGTSRKPRQEGEAVAAGGAARTGAYACFALCAAAVAYGIYLIVAA
ncbi:MULTISPECIES: hypothetical protein [Streptomyces]|uniref:Uncharacterized protein n=2 Tax=Streptomyces rimosus subsp. rimosus TaxID=132474 RepID=L8EFD8_STRR1|nr:MULTISPECIES: hypothetical protein [Streptomyces]KOG77238.1 membrane protein [Kitasatospora aureofaciens]MYT43823.1 hypothetical protein [Streptomyces sp. SID5471]KEF17896.1 membrane protein [Streptomyces rimosus]KOT35087.1 membrane protein [Streptomyces rimosus subsp. rimosus]KOT45311.1 membrane protein [Streptomyces sp. NRRL WC-3701]